MFRLRQTEMDRREGTATVVLLADKSGSMRFEAFTTMDRVVPDFRRAIPDLRVFVFHANLREVGYTRAGDDVASAWADDGITDAEWRWQSRTGRRINRCTTFLGACLESVADLKPRKTILFCDGGAADKKRALRAADRITGEIDCYWFPSRDDCLDKPDEDVGFMQQLARRGRGRFVNFDGPADLGVELRRSLHLPQHHNSHGAQHMRHRSPGGRVDIHAPPVQVVRVEEHIIVERQRIIHHVDADDVHVQENAPTDAQIQIEASQVHAHENHQVIETRVGAKPRGFFMAMLLGPAKRSAAPQQPTPQLAPPQVIDKGALRPVPHQASVALSSPQRQAAPAPGLAALPAPQRQHAPQLAHQPEQPLPMPAQRKKSWSIL